jgi:DNA-binding transcriptional LysR family regulator
MGNIFDCSLCQKPDLHLSFKEYYPRCTAPKATVRSSSQPSSGKLRKELSDSRYVVAADPVTDTSGIDFTTVVSSALSLRSIVLSGSGPALLADWLVGEDIAAGRLVDVLPDYEAAATTFDTAAWIMYPSRSYLPQKVRVMIDFLRERAGQG